MMANQKDYDDGFIKKIYWYLLFLQLIPNFHLFLCRDQLALMVCFVRNIYFKMMHEMYNSNIYVLYFPCPFTVLLLNIFVRENTIDRKDRFMYCYQWSKCYTVLSTELYCWKQFLSLCQYICRAVLILMDLPGKAFN